MKEGIGIMKPVMTDEEVGKLWKWTNWVLAERKPGLASTQPATRLAEDMAGLIHKLVMTEVDHYFGPCLAETLKKYGIPLDEFNNYQTS